MRLRGECARCKWARTCGARSLYVCCGACGDTLPFPRMGDCASEALGGGRHQPHPAAMYIDCRRGLCAPNSRRKLGGRWKVEARHNGTTVRATHVHVCTRCVSCMCRVGALCCTLLHFAPRRSASLAIRRIHSFIHSLLTHSFIHS